jgi:maltose alpha-D-glucosyltransferase/alpha-amylase
VRAKAQILLPLKHVILERFRLAVDRKITAMRIRCHGDYHLGQLLFTGKDFVVIDFEGEPARPLAERRGKRSALVDVAAMLRSIDYAATYGLKTGEFRSEDQPRLAPWAQLWVTWVSTMFLESYVKSVNGGGFLPASMDEVKTLLDLCTLQKAIYELSYELNNRPDWVDVPITGVLEILQSSP